jgi:hypothetical protein
MGGAFLLATWMNARWRPQQAALNRFFGGVAVAFLVFGMAAWIVG